MEWIHYFRSSRLKRGFRQRLELTLVHVYEVCHVPRSQLECLTASGHEGGGG